MGNIIRSYHEKKVRKELVEYIQTRRTLEKNMEEKTSELYKLVSGLAGKEIHSKEELDSTPEINPLIRMMLTTVESLSKSARQSAEIFQGYIFWKKNRVWTSLVPDWIAKRQYARYASRPTEEDLKAAYELERLDRIDKQF